MDTAFIIGNGESRNIYSIEKLKGNGIVYGCNGIYRDYPMLCDHIVAVNPPMYDELAQWHNNGKESPQIYGIDDISKWNYICQGDDGEEVPEGLKLYRLWRGGDIKKGGCLLHWGRLELGRGPAAHLPRPPEEEARQGGGVCAAEVKG